VHERFTYGEAADIDWSALRPEDYDARTREAGRRSFVLRALDEQRSLLAFSELLAELCEAGAPVDVIGSMTRIVRDEALHVDLCGRIVEALGGFGDDAPEPHWVRSDRRLPLHLRILRSVVGSCCIGETVSVQMIAGVRKSACDPVVAPVLTQMLADESFHSRFGWWWLEAHTLTDDEHAYLEKWLPKVFRAIEEGARPTKQALERQASRPYVASPFGSMSATEREAAFMKAVEETILPGLTKAGVDAARLWQARAEVRA
jgi:hypothetical protein